MSEPFISEPSPQSEMPAGAQPPAAQALPLSLASIIAIVAGFIAIVAFFALAYFHVGVQVAGIQIEHAPTGRELAGGGVVAALPRYVVLWLVPLVGLIALIVGLLPLGVRTITRRTSGLVFLVSGALGVLALVLMPLQAKGDFERVSNVSGQFPVQLTGLGLTYGFSLGFWVSLLAMLALIVAGALALRGR
ncbi:MAG TPA: hypothetical protein VFY89_10745, partial [Ktedonobacterales bacterium]